VSYILLGSRGPQAGAADTTGNNTGNWTIAFTPGILNVNVAEFECYKIVVTGAAGSTFTVFIENKQWDLAIYGAANSWDPMQPMILRPGQTLYFYYSDAVTDNTPPVATIWLRYDPEVTS
jgi:hypothetical protein